MTTDDVVGISEIAEILAVTSERVGELSLRADFPLPVTRFPLGRAWHRKDIETWARDTRAMP